MAPWQSKLGAFLLYPARVEVLPALVMLTACTVAAGFLSIVGLIVAALVMLTAYTFAFEILQHHANGWDDPPESVLTVSSHLVFQYLLVLFIAALLIGVTHRLLGTLAGLLLLAFFSLAQPAFTIVSVIEGSVLAALNPAKWLRLMHTLGNGYFMLAVLLFLGQLLEGWIGNRVFSFMPGFLAATIVKIIGLWILFASAYWMGYLIYQYHRELGFEPEAHRDQAVRGLDRDGILIQAIDLAIANQQYDEAIEKMKYESRERVPGIALHTKFRELLIKKDDAELIRQHAQTYLHQLLTEKNMPRALSLAIQQFNIDSDFFPMDGETADPLVKEARRVGQTGLEKKLLVSMLGHFPTAPLAADWAVRLDEILLQAGESGLLALDLLDAAVAATRNETQRLRLLSTRRTLAASK